MSEQMLTALEAALPQDVDITSYSGARSEGESWDVAVNFTRTDYVNVEVFRSPETPIDPRHRADPCRIDLMKRRHLRPARQCEVITIGQQRIGVGVFEDGGVDVWFALRHYGDWTIMLHQRGRVVLSTGEMAALVSNAAFEP